MKNKQDKKKEKKDGKTIITIYTKNNLHIRVCLKGSNPFDKIVKKREENSMIDKPLLSDNSIIRNSSIFKMFFQPATNCIISTVKIFNVRFYIKKRSFV